MNPFISEKAVQTHTTQSAGALIDIEGQRAIQEVQAAMVIAQRFPRNPINAVDRILNACTRPTLAESALYSYSRGGSEITGPSIRLAEAMAQCWGNLQYGIREISQSNGESTVEAYCWDVETNTRQSKVFQVPHARHSRAGVKKLTDPRDIYETVANHGARRLRACILGVIPADVVEAALEQCEKTLHAKVDMTKDGLSKLAACFGELGISREMIEKRTQKRLESINAAQVIGLRKIYQSIKDGMSSPGDWFDVQSAGIAKLDKELMTPKPQPQKKDEKK